MIYVTENFISPQQQMEEESNILFSLQNSMVKNIERLDMTYYLPTRLKAISEI